MDNDTIEIAEAAAILRVSVKTLYRLTKAKKVPHRKVGKQIRFSRSGLRTWLGASEEKRAS